jgi:hypothetical protein
VFHNCKETIMGERGSRAIQAVAVCLVAATVLVGTADAAGAAVPEPPPFCASLVGAEKDHDGYSVVLARACSDISPEAAAAALPAVVRTRLMTWYVDAGWRGRSEDRYGSQGTCDREGYTFRPDYYWSRHMSSVRGYGACNVVWLSNGDHSTSARLPYSFGATQFNDDVWKLNVSNL